jgi:hypothetical protein
METWRAAVPRSRRWTDIHQFDLTEAEQYLADEFASKADDAFAWPLTVEI